MLHVRGYDPKQVLLLGTDASDCAITGILSQKFDDGNIHPSGFLSQKLSTLQLNYNAYDKEMLAIV
jgi:hypothetical protein